MCRNSLYYVSLVLSVDKKANGFDCGTFRSYVCYDIQLNKKVPGDVSFIGLIDEFGSCLLNICKAVDSVIGVYFYRIIYYSQIIS